MKKITRIFICCLIYVILISVNYLNAQDVKDAKKLIEDAWDYMRDLSSYAEIRMTVHRPEWERNYVLKAWTKGRKKSIFFLEYPPRDKGNGTLKKEREMWTFNPKIKRVIKIPPSMMSQSWMGSDFSNNDLAKADSVLEDYQHELIATEEHEGHKVYVIQAIPKTNAPVVWGKEILKLRDDFILLQESFYDEDMQLVKEMTVEQIEMIGGKLYPKIWYMKKADITDEYTKLEYNEAKFNINIPDNYFTISNLKNPRRLPK